MFHALVCLTSLRLSTLHSHSLSHLLLHPPHLSLHLLCGSVRRETPCALPRMGSLAFLSTTPLSQVMSPNSSTTTSSQRPLKFSSRNPPATLILADCRAEIQKHEFQADYDRRSIQKLNELSSLNDVRLIVHLGETNNFDGINNFFMNNCRNKIGISVKLKIKVSMKWKN